MRDIENSKEEEEQDSLIMKPYSLKKSSRRATELSFSGEHYSSKKSLLLNRKEAQEIQNVQKGGRAQSLDVMQQKPRIEYQRLDDQFELVTHKLQLIIVNDHDNQFCPVLEFNFSEFQYIFEQSTGSHTKLSFQSYYYNPQYSLWEPFIQNMVLEFIMISSKGESSFQVRSLDTVNINISEMLCQNLINAKESWDKTYDRFVEEIELQQVQGSQRPRLESRLSIQSDENYRHFGEDVHLEAYHQQDRGVVQHRYRVPSMFDSSTPALPQSGMRTERDSLRNNEDTVSPYTIQNFSGFQIFVQKTLGERQSTGEGILNLQKYIVENGNTLQIEIDYEQRIAGELWREEYDPLTKSANEDAVKIVISDAERSYYPIEKVSFGSVGFFTHNLKTGRSYIPFGLYEFLIYEVTLRKMRKIIRLRTPYMFFNKTDYNYMVRFSKNAQPCSFWVRKIAPGQMMPIPIQDISCFISLAIQLGDSQPLRASSLSMQQPASQRFQQIQWSGDFQMADFSNVRNDAYLSLQHGERYTYINKQVQHSMAVDFLIVAPILIYNALPCTLKLAIPREETESCHLKTGEHRYINSYSFGEKIPLMMTIDGFEWGQYVIQANDKPRTGEDIRLKLKEMRERSSDKDSGQNLNLYLRVLSGGAGKRFVVYARTVILNKTDQSLTFYYNKHNRNKMARVAGQHIQSRRNMVLISDREKLRACLHNDFSDMFTIAGSGVQGEFAIKTQEGLHQRFYQFSFKTSISLIMENEYIYSKVVTIAPKYVLINMIPSPIQIVQSDYFQFVQEIAPNERKPFYWFSKRADKLIRAREVEKPEQEELKGEDTTWQQDWAFSNPFLLQELGIISVTNRHSIHRNAVRFLRIERRMIDETIYIMIDKESQEHPVFRFENHCMGMSILYKQKGAESCDHLGVRESALFAWQDLTQPEPLLEVCFLIGNINERPVFVDGTKIQLNLNILDTNTTISIPTNQLQAGRKVLVNITTDGHTRIVKFYQITESNIQLGGHDDKIQKVKQSFQIDLREIGLSFVMKSFSNRRIELAYVNIVDLRGMMVDTTDDMRNMQFRIGYLQIDNMGALKNVYPVLVKPKYLEKVEQGKGYKKPFLDISTDINLQNTKVRHFDRIECLLQTIAIKIEDDFLNLFFQFVTTVFKQVNSTFTKVNPLFKLKVLLPASSSRMGSRLSSFQQGGDPLPQDFTPWRTVSTLRQAKMIYIAKLSVSPLDLEISFLSRSSNTKSEKQALSSISQAFGVTIKNFQNANIRLNHIESDHVFGSSGDIIEQVFSLYKQRFLRNIFYIIGSIDILGNPINLFSSLGTGVKDFFFKPAQGFVKGPLQGGYGLLKGTSSLMKHSVQGAFGMSSKITSTMSKVLLTLMNDKDFNSARERKEITEKPKHVVDGVGYGLKSVFQSVGSGVIGIVAEPVKGAKRGGAKGFFTGTLKGVTGVFAKSAIGVLDLVSKTSEGIKNTAGIFDRKSEDRRVRHPRCFYGSGDIIRPYEQNDSLVKVFLDRVKKGLFLQDHFLESYMYEVKHKLFMLLMTTEHVALIDTNQINVVWNIRSSSMMLVQKHRNGLKIFLKVRENRENSVAMEMDPNDKNGINYLHSRLTILINEDI